MSENHTYHYFSQRDFDHATPRCSIEDMNPVFLKKVDVARHHAGVPFIVTSAYRDIDYELNKGRDGTSSHTKGLALDLRAANSEVRYKIIQGLIKAGFHRIGISKKSGFIHVDDDPDKDANVIWLY